MLKKRIYKELIELASVVLFTVLMGYVLTTFVGFVLQGYEESFSESALNISDVFIKNSFYNSMLLIAIIGYVILKGIELLIYRGEDPITSNKFGLISIGHDPQEDGFIFRGLKMILPRFSKWASNPIRIFLISFIIFSIVGLFSSTNGTFFTGIPQTEFQITPVTQTVFASEPASSAENGLFIFVIFGLIASLILNFLKLFIKDKKIRVAVYFTSLSIIGTIIMALLWGGYHSIRYGNDEIIFLATIIFG